MIRESGYYWVRFNDDSELTVAYWDGSDFGVTNDDRIYEEHDFYYINETRIEPPEPAKSVIEIKYKASKAAML